MYLERSSKKDCKGNLKEKMLVEIKIGFNLEKEEYIQKDGFLFNLLNIYTLIPSFSFSSLLFSCTLACFLASHLISHILVNYFF